MDINTTLLSNLCGYSAPSGNEELLTVALNQYVQTYKSNWMQYVRTVRLLNNLVLIFGAPKVAYVAHIDNVGYTVANNFSLLPIGEPFGNKPYGVEGYNLVGQDSIGTIECPLVVNNNKLSYSFGREIDLGTCLSFKKNWRLTETTIQCCYLDNRSSVHNCLRLAEIMTNGIIMFSTDEEHWGGSIPKLLNYCCTRYPTLRYIVVCDVTWPSTYVSRGEGVVIGMRGDDIPRLNFQKRIINVIKDAGVKYQLEILDSGASDGSDIQQSPYILDWCFLGTTVGNPHTPNEILTISDMKDQYDAMVALMNLSPS